MRTLDHFWFEFGIEADFSEYSVAATRDDEVLTLELVPLPDNDWSRITGGAISRSLNYCGRGELARRVYTSLMLATLQAAEAAVLPQWLRDGMTICCCGRTRDAPAWQGEIPPESATPLRAAP